MVGQQGTRDGCARIAASPKEMSSLIDVKSYNLWWPWQFTWWRISGYNNIYWNRIQSSSGSGRILGDPLLTCRHCKSKTWSLSQFRRTIIESTSLLLLLGGLKISLNPIPQTLAIWSEGLIATLNSYGTTYTAQVILRTQWTGPEIVLCYGAGIQSIAF